MNIDTFKLETLTLSGFDKSNKEHLQFFKKLVNDKTITTRFRGMGSLLHNYPKNTFFDRGLLIYDNNDLIGYLNIGGFNEKENAVYLRAAIDIEKRGKNYGKMVLSEVTNYIFKNYNFVSYIKLCISDDNIPSIKTALSCGYSHSVNQIYCKENTITKKL